MKNNERTTMYIKNSDFSSKFNGCSSYQLRQICRFDYLDGGKFGFLVGGLKSLVFRYFSYTKRCIQAQIISTLMKINDMKITNLIFYLYLILFPIIILVNFNSKVITFLIISGFMILYSIIDLFRTKKIYKKFGVKYSITSSNKVGLKGLSFSWISLLFVILYCGLFYYILKLGLHHKPGSMTILMMFNLVGFIYFSISFMLSDIKITQKGIIDSNDTKLILYSNLVFHNIDKTKNKIDLRHNNLKKFYSLQVDKSSKIKFDDLVNYLKDKIE